MAERWYPIEEGVAVLDASCRPLACNRALRRQLGLPGDGCEGLAACLELAGLGRGLSAQGAWTGEVAHAGGGTCRAQAERLGELVVLRSPGEAGAPERLLQLARAEALPRLAEGMVHDARNPLNVMAIHLAVIADRVRARDPGLLGEIDHSLATLREQVARTEAVLRRFLRFASPERVPGPVDLAELVRKAVELCTHDANRSGVRLQAELQDATVAGDAASLSQAVVQLVLRSVDAGVSGGSVRVALESREREAVLSVSELGGPEGPGCRKPVDLAAGRDLPLSVAEQIIEVHRGNLAASAGGGWARVEVRLPLARSGAAGDGQAG